MSKNLDAHPLFPAASDDDEAAEVITIQVFRIDNGQKQLIPRRYAANDLTDEMQIFDQYGGGTYELVSRNDKHITCRRGIVLPGPSKPLYNAPAAPPAEQSAMPVAAPGMPAWIGVLSVFMPVILQMLNSRSQMDQRAQEQMQLLMATMMKQAQDSNTHMVTLLTTMNRPDASAGQGAQFRDGMNFMQELLAGQLEKANGQREEEGESADLMKTIAQLSQGLEMIGLFKGVTDGGAPVATPPVGDP